MIHPSAHIAATARLAADVRIGAGAVIEDEVMIGAGCVIGPHAVIHAGVTLGARNRVGAHAVLGGAPQDVSVDPEAVAPVVIGDDNVFREGVTVNRPTRPGGATRIGSRCYLMNNAHVGHDCVVGDRVIMASGTALGGHVQVGDAAFIGGGAMVHQFCRVGTLAMVGGLVGVTQDVLPYALVAGHRARHYRLNLVGLRRAGVGGERLRVLSEAFRRLRARRTLVDLPATPELQVLRAWLAADSRRGVAGFVRAPETPHE
ncbi:MAG: acyl-ACP--UDP-N-acetylglucosamine O-acyltransferase [Burkholderiaceae bacterium]|nr:acyl-ACP--UDP-N-acetylglucosamine O-acyltransferase [Burkholderiaceae bacterium]